MATGCEDISIKTTNVNPKNENNWVMNKVIKSHPLGTMNVCT